MTVLGLGGWGAAVAVAKWTHLTRLRSSDRGPSGYISQHNKGQKKSEGVNLRGIMHWTTMNGIWV